MWDEFLRDHNFVFMISLCFFAAIAVIEIVGLLIGFSSFSHDMDVSVDSDADFDFDFGSNFFNWIGFGRIPLMAFIAIVSATFGLSGIIINHIAENIYMALPPLISVPAAIAVALPIISITTGFVARVMPRDETEAIGLAELVGCTATITHGSATHEVRAFAYTYDRYGTMHNISVLALDESTVLAERTKVRLEHLSDQGVFLASPMV